MVRKITISGNATVTVQMTEEIGILVNQYGVFLVDKSASSVKTLTGMGEDYYCVYSKSAGAYEFTIRNTTSYSFTYYYFEGDLRSRMQRDDDVSSNESVAVQLISDGGMLVAMSKLSSPNYGVFFAGDSTATITGTGNTVSINKSGQTLNITGQTGDGSEFVFVS